MGEKISVRISRSVIRDGNATLKADISLRDKPDLNGICAGEPFCKLNIFCADYPVENRPRKHISCFTNDQLFFYNSSGGKFSKILHFTIFSYSEFIEVILTTKFHACKNHFELLV